MKKIILSCGILILALVTVFLIAVCPAFVKTFNNPHPIWAWAYIYDENQQIVEKRVYISGYQRMGLKKMKLFVIDEEGNEQGTITEDVERVRIWYFEED